VKVSCASTQPPRDAACRQVPASACRVPLARSLARAARLLGGAVCPEPPRETPRAPVAGVDEPLPGRRLYAVRPLGAIPEERTPQPPATPPLPRLLAGFHVTNLGTLIDVLA
jgi:hypothetical protein